MSFVFVSSGSLYIFFSIDAEQTEQLCRALSAPTRPRRREQYVRMGTVCPLDICPSSFLLENREVSPTSVTAEAEQPQSQGTKQIFP